eukprot:7968526-Alexandrium_andersonii.AAC.1
MVGALVGKALRDPRCRHPFSAHCGCKPSPPTGPKTPDRLRRAAPEKQGSAEAARRGASVHWSSRTSK